MKKIIDKLKNVVIPLKDDLKYKEIRAIEKMSSDIYDVIRYSFACGYMKGKGK